METRARLEEAAVALTLRDGPEQVTIDAVSERAGVSPRTFFNYFDSKEDAILGIHDVELTDDFLAEHLARADGAETVESVTGLLFAIIGPAITDPALHESRVQIIKSNPQLLGRQVSQFTRMAGQIVDAITALLARDPRFSDLDPNNAQPTAELLLALCSGGLRAAVKEWIAAGSDSPAAELEQRAAALVRQTVERLT